MNVYAVETEDGLILIDGGWAVESARSRLEQSLAAVGFRMSDVSRFLVTHVHRDHYSQAVAVRSQLGTKVSLGIGERPALHLLREGGDRVSHSIVGQLRAAGAPWLADAWLRIHHDEQNETSVWELPDEWIDADTTVVSGSRTLDAVATPGHTQGHLVFVDRRSGLLFSGDHVLSTITPSIGLEPAGSPRALTDFLTSLRKVLTLPDLRLLPAHGPVTGSSHDRVRELLAHHEQRLKLCGAATHADGSTAYEVARSLPWTKQDRSFSELDETNAAVATMETRAHLEHLAELGELTRTEASGVTTYAPR